MLIKKVWERFSGIEPRRLWTELNNTQTELNNTQTELNNTQNELNNTQTELNNTRVALQEICVEFISLGTLKQTLSKDETVDVSVVIPTKDRLEFLLRSLESINRQSKKPQEIVVINNGNQFSQYEEQEIRHSCDLVSNLRIIDAQQLKDVSACRNRGLQASTSRYVTYLDDDNTMWPTWLEKSYKFVSESCIDFAYGAQLREDYFPHYFSEKFSSSKIIENNFIDTNSIIHTRGNGRWSAGVTRLADWSFVLNWINDYPKTEITQLHTISTIYKNDAPNRITSPLYSPYKVLIGLLHNLIPESVEILEARKNFCIICSSTNSFSEGPNGRKGAVCPTCGSLERHRALKLINEALSGYLHSNLGLGKVIEAAPSEVSTSIFSEYGTSYSSFDKDPEADGRKCDFTADICDLPLHDDSVIEFVALHVLEHVENDTLAMQEISRVLAPNGICILQVPLADPPWTTREDIIENDVERIAVYGQIDHVRLYGEDILYRMKMNGLEGFLFSIREMLPDFLIQILGLEDGARFILAMPVKNNKSEWGMSELSTSLKNDFSKLDIFSDLIKERKRSIRVEET
jgi:SAM-dependent methyltransferase